MQPRDRLLRTWRGESADRVPLVLQGIEAPSRDALSDVADPLRREVAERVLDETCFLVGVPSHINRMLVTPPQVIRSTRVTLPNGHTEVRGVIPTSQGELTYLMEHAPESATWWTHEYPVKDRADIGKIASLPWEAPASLAPVDRLGLPDEFPVRGIAVCRISSPFVCAAGMMRYEMFLEMCHTDLSLLVELSEMCTERVLACLEVLLSGPGIDCVWMGGSEWVTPPMASPAVYDALVQEQERRVIRYVHENSDAIIHVHCHGNVRRALEQMIDRSVDYTEPVEPPPDGDVTMAEAKAIAAGRIALGGNVEVRLVCRAEQDEVEAAARAAFEGGKDRFVFRPTEGPSPRMDGVEFRNYMRMIDVWEELSPVL
jgi:hypothetical protein